MTYTACEDCSATSESGQSRAAGCDEGVETRGGDRRATSTLGNLSVKVQVVEQGIATYGSRS